MIQVLLAAWLGCGNNPPEASPVLRVQRTFDDAGRLVEVREVDDDHVHARKRYLYDDRGLLVERRRESLIRGVPTGVTIDRYRYDADGRRIAGERWLGGTLHSSETWTWDGEGVVHRLFDAEKRPLGEPRAVTPAP